MPPVTGSITTRSPVINGRPIGGPPGWISISTRRVLSSGPGDDRLAEDEVDEAAAVVATGTKSRSTRPVSTTWSAITESVAAVSIRERRRPATARRQRRRVVEDTVLGGEADREGLAHAGVRQVMPAMRVESDEEAEVGEATVGEHDVPWGQAPSGAVVVGAWVVSTGVVVLVGCGSLADVEGAAASSTQAASTTSHTMQGTRRRTTTG